MRNHLVYLLGDPLLLGVWKQIMVCNSPVPFHTTAIEEVWHGIPSIHVRRVFSIPGMGRCFDKERWSFVPDHLHRLMQVRTLSTVSTVVLSSHQLTLLKCTLTGYEN